MALPFPNITVDKLVIGKSFVISQTLHRRRVESKVAGLQRLLNINFEDLDRIGRGSRVDKTFLWPARCERIIVELDEKARHWQVELQAVLGVAR